MHRSIECDFNVERIFEASPINSFVKTMKTTDIYRAHDRRKRRWNYVAKITCATPERKLYLLERQISHSLKKSSGVRDLRMSVLSLAAFI